MHIAAPHGLQNEALPDLQREDALVLVSMVFSSGISQFHCQLQLTAGSGPRS